MESESNGFAAYQLFSNQLAAENSLLDNRMQWALTINGALLALVAGGLGIGKSLVGLPSWWSILAAAALTVGIGVIAIRVSRQSTRAMDEARSQILNIMGTYKTRWSHRIEQELGLPRPFGEQTEVPKNTKKDDTLAPWWAGEMLAGARALWCLIILVTVGVAALAELHLVTCGASVTN